MQQFQEMNEYGEISAAPLFKTVHFNDEGSSAPPTPTPTIPAEPTPWGLPLFFSFVAFLGSAIFTDNGWAMGITMALTLVFGVLAGASTEGNK